MLRYHRIADLDSDPHAICVTPEHFRQHLEVLRRYYTPVSWRDVIRSLNGEPLPRAAAALTFDDGYTDNLLAAVPVLAEFDVPATVFVTAGYLDGQREFWWDEVERMLLRPGRLPARLDLHIDGEECSWSLGTKCAYTQDDYARYRDWSWRRSDDPTPRHRVFRELLERLKGTAAPTRERVLEALRATAEVDASRRPTHRTLTVSELLELGSNRLIEIGAHTLSHPLLPALDRECQWQEVNGSRAALEDVLDRPVRSFAYPYGVFDEDTVTLTRRAGFSSACGTAAGRVRRRADRYRLPRIYAGDWDGHEFERRITMAG